MNPISRRTFLQSTGALGAALIHSSSQAAEEGGGFIDAHVHVWTPDTDRYPLAEGRKKEDMKPASFTPEELFAHCKPVGVSRVVLIQMSFYRYDNRYMLDSMAAHPGVFAGVGVIDEQSPGVADTMRSLAGKDVRGFRIVSGQDHAASWQGSAGMKTLWKTGAETRQAMCCLVNPEALPAIAGMCRDFPETPVVIDHFARIGASGTVVESDLENLLRLADFPTVHVKTSAFYALGKKKAPYEDLGPMIRRLRDAFGA
ncbi:MAG: amidohydrolase family protein, partial [Verrucomicrobiae bacterium]|nr:amidohydrolase family protein [Verrucomicrobiae bacterium]